MLDGDLVNDSPAVFTAAVLVGEALGLGVGVEDFGPRPAAVSVEVRDVKFLNGVVFHESSLQPGSDNSWKQPRVLWIGGAGGGWGRRTRSQTDALVAGSAHYGTVRARPAPE